MFKLLGILFIFKLYAHNNVFDHECNFGKAFAPISRQNIKQCYSATIFEKFHVRINCPIC